MSAPDRIWIHSHPDDDTCPYFFESDEIGKDDTWMPNVEYIRRDAFPVERIKAYAWALEEGKEYGAARVLRDILELLGENDE